VDFLAALRPALRTVTATPKLALGEAELACGAIALTTRSGLAAAEAGAATVRAAAVAARAVVVRRIERFSL
jgi:hypothetical protein